MGTPDRKNCRWRDRYFEDVCRNEATHPSVVFVPELGLLRIEPKCDGPKDRCGFEDTTPETPAWDADMEF